MLSNVEIEKIIRDVYEKCGYRFVNVRESLEIMDVRWSLITALRYHNQIDTLGQLADELIPINHDNQFRIGPSLRSLIGDLCLVAEKSNAPKKKSKTDGR